MDERGRRRDRVLLVAAQNEDTMLLAGLLTTAGYSLSTVFDSETAIELCSAAMPDHAIIDLTTPGIDGLSLAGALRRIESQRQMRIVTIAARGSVATNHDALDVEVTYPATVTKLIDALAPRDQRERA
jgi:DNA-binding response OmpR family regulator